MPTPLNPYSPPPEQASTRPQQAAWQPNRVTRDGPWMIIARDAELRPRCFVTGRDTQCAVRVKSFWQPPWLIVLVLAGILPYLVIAPFFRHTFELLVPIAPDVLAAHQRRTAIAAGVTVLSIAALYALFLTQYNGVWLAHLIWLLVIAGVTAFFISSSPPVRLRIERLDETGLVVRDLPARCLEGLPAPDSPRVRGEGE